MQYSPWAVEYTLNHVRIDACCVNICDYVAQTHTGNTFGVCARQMNFVRYHTIVIIITNDAAQCNMFLGDEIMRKMFIQWCTCTCWFELGNQRVMAGCSILYYTKFRDSSYNGIASYSNSIHVPNINTCSYCKFSWEKMHAVWQYYFCFTGTTT